MAEIVVRDPRALRPLNQQRLPPVRPAPLPFPGTPKARADVAQTGVQTQKTGVEIPKVQAETVQTVQQTGIAGEKHERETGDFVRRMNTMGSKIDQDILTVDEILNDPNLEAVTGSIEGRLPTALNVIFKGKDGQKVDDLQAKIDFVKANATLTGLVNLRTASPTGAALGNSSDRDIDLLSKAGARLQQAQSLPAFRAALSAYKEQLRVTKANAIEAYHKDVAAGLIKGSRIPEAGSSNNWVYRNGKLERE